MGWGLPQGSRRRVDESPWIDRVASRGASAEALCGPLLLAPGVVCVPPPSPGGGSCHFTTGTGGRDGGRDCCFWRSDSVRRVFPTSLRKSPKKDSNPPISSLRSDRCTDPTL